ncbi:MAG: saccharopine dehydrogenase, partial [Solirubrobacterales bacterium]|nr:saccharopine dehydrogenase [Solirubrobacterales bacterium]
RTVAEARVRTGNPYELTAALLAWGAEVAATGGLRATGALGPVDAFGLEALRKGAQEAGARVG